MSEIFSDKNVNMTPRKKLKLKKVIQFISSSIILLSCGETSAPYTENVTLNESTEISLTFRRFDLDLYKTSFTDAIRSTDSLRNNYKSFFCDFVESDIRIGACFDSATANELVNFRNHPDILATHQEIERIFTTSKMEEIQAAITQMMNRKIYFFPDARTQEFIFYQAAWNNRISVNDSIIGIALDHYLGPGSKAISSLTPDLFPQYKKRDMTPEMILPDLAKSISSYDLSPHYQVNGTLLDEIIIYGKMLCMAKALVPQFEDSTLLSYTAEQYEWACENEWNTWRVLARNKTLYNTQRKEIERWFSEGPFTGVQGIPQESAPQLGAFIGWNMVKQYADKNPEMTLQNLIAIQDSRTFLETYTPQKK
jgi:hypothetical protein